MNGAIFVILVTAILLGVSFALSHWVRFPAGHPRRRRQILIVGLTERARRLSVALSRLPQSGMFVAGYLATDHSEIGQDDFGYPILGTVADITSVLKGHAIDEVIVTLPAAESGTTDVVLRACQREGIRVRVSAESIEAPQRSIPDISESTLEREAPAAWKLALKRLLDIGVAGAALPAFLPLMVAIAYAVKLDSPGRVFFAQDRIGLNGRRFRLLKFRTMWDGSEHWQEELEPLNQATGPVFKIFDDPRITRVGRLLRRTSLDELPQLFNVLRGDMSLVGPRPMSLRDIGRLDRRIQHKRFSVKPGITGLWQISGRSKLPSSRSLQLDLWYIEKWSLWLDIKILFRTVPAVVRGIGAA